MRRWHASRSASARALAAAVIASTTGLTAAAFAQDEPPLALNRFEPSPFGDRFFGLVSPYPGDHLMPHGGVVLDYSHDPLVLVQEGEDGDETVGSIVEHQLYLHVGASFGLFDYVSVNLSMPFALYQAGDSPDDGGGNLVSPDHAQVGDLRAGLKVRIWGEQADPFQIGVAGYFWFPTGPSDEGSFVGEGTVRGMPMLVLGGRYEWLLWTLNGGPEFRSSQQFVNTAQGTMMHYGLGLAAVVGDDDEWQVGPEISLATVFEGLESRNTNAEGLLGAKWRFIDFMEAGLAVGTGLSSGIGTPDFRGVFSLAATPKPKSDRDGDGIEDAVDACPDEPGVESDDPNKHGCPAEADRDGDGIADSVDACPDVPGAPSDDPTKNGCPPDRDGDGIADPADACPDVPGVPSDDPTKNGCPAAADRDGDGVLDPQDACPDVPGAASEDPKKNGCPPDRDGDGIADSADACPDVPGAPSDDPTKNGCQAVMDRDGDGILDADDACPDAKGKPDPDPKKNGCPTVVVTATEIKIMQKVMFDTNRATIKAESDSILNDVAEVLTSNPDIKKIEIQGHTDSQGGAAFNQVLSQRRADSVKAALVKRGIDAGRLTTKGYGLTVPIGDNKTADGRELNRRVEFKILERAPAPQAAP